MCPGECRDRQLSLHRPLLLLLVRISAFVLPLHFPEEFVFSSRQTHADVLLAAGLRSAAECQNCLIQQPRICECRKESSWLRVVEEEVCHLLTVCY